MFEGAIERAPRNAIADWCLRAAIAAAFIVFGMEKFSSAPGSQWVDLFQQIRLGQWFRYFTGVIEVAGGMLVLVPWTVSLGLLLLVCTMAAASLIWIFVLGQPGNSIITGAFLAGLTVFWLNRRQH